MKRITSKLLNYPLTPKFLQLRHIKYAQQAKLAAPTRSKSFKKSVAPLTTSKSLKIVKFENVEGIPPKWFEWFFRGLTKSFRVLKKVVFQSASFDYALKAQAYGLKKIMKNIRHLETLSLVYFKASYLKYCRSLKNIKLCVSETTSPTSALSKIRHLKQLERVEVCLSDEDQALNMLKEIHHRVKAPHCWLDITLMKAFWPYCDNIESISHQTFKKVASVELNLAKISAIPVVDNNTLEAHLKFLKFLFEAGDKSQRRRRNFECLKFPGMKLNIDRKEYDSPPKIYSLLENFLSVYDSSVFHVKEYSPENNLAKLYFELTSWASSWEILELLKDIIEIKDIKFLHLELDVKGMTEREFNNIIENICKIERLQFLYVASGAFSMEVKYPAEKIPAGLAGSGRSMVELRG